MSLAEALAGRIQEVCETERVADAGLDALAVSVGPGSFTGLRMGVAMAKAMAQSLGVPLVGVPTHECIAWPLSIAAGTPICVLQHARKEDVYASIFACRGGSPEVTWGPDVIPVQALFAQLAGKSVAVALVGDGLADREAAVREALGEGAIIAPRALWLPRAGWVGAIAQGRVANADPDAATNLRPVYLLVSQAERTHGVDLGLK